MTTKVKDIGFNFSNVDNQCACIAPNQIIAFVEKESYYPALISYNLGENKVKFLKQWSIYWIQRRNNKKDSSSEYLNQYK